MKTKIFGILQRVGRSFMLPIAVLPVAGLFLGLGSSLTNETTIASLHLEAILSKGTFINGFLVLLMDVGSAFFNNLPIIFAAAVALGMAKKAKEVAVLSAIIAFFVMHTTINGMLTLNGSILENQVISATVLDGTITSVCGILSLEMGVFGGIIVGLGVSYLHNRFYQIELPNVISFFEGERFIPIISTVTFLFVGVAMFYIWPFIQNAIYELGKMIASSGYVGTFMYGLIERLLVPFGLHHVFYLPFWQTAIGGTMMVNGVAVSGGQNIFFAQLADPTVTHFSIEATKYFTGKYILMIFGLPGAALAMYHCTKAEDRKRVGSLLLPAALTSLLTGITEPLEFSFLFAAPVLFGIESILAGSAYMIAHIFNVAIGLTFSGGIIDLFVFGVLQGNAKTSWLLIIPIGIVYFFLFYGIFKVIIKKRNLKIPEIGSNNKLKPHQKFNQESLDPQAQLIIKGLGGRNNFSDLDCCITRLRVTIKDKQLVNEGLLKQSGAAAIVMQGNGIQIIYGPKASSIKTKLDEYLLNVPIILDESKLEKEYNQTCEELGNIVDGEVAPIEEAPDQIFAHKLLGDGVMIKPRHGLIVAPCAGEITMIYPTKHAIGMKLNNGCEILLHFGTDTVKLNGAGFEVLVKLNQKVKKGDLLWNADIDYIKEKATDENIFLIFTKLNHNYKLAKKYGEFSRGATIIELCN